MIDLSDLAKINERYNMFSEITPETSTDAEFAFSAKDNLTAVGFQARAGSAILEGYRPVFDAACVERMRSAGGFLVGKTNMDEFGFGSFSMNSAYGVPRNPYDIERSCGGSSGGAACAAAVIDGHVALGVSTGGSIACPASFCGVYGMAPTYGRVSRYGLIDYGNSMDKVGILSGDAKDLGRYLPLISGDDMRDPVSCNHPPLQKRFRKLRSVAVVRGEASAGVNSAMGSAEEELRSMSVDVETVSMDTLRYALPAYYVLASAEGSTNIARYCGLRYGRQDGDLTLKFDDYFTKMRSRYLGEETKRRVILGTFTRMMGFRDKYYAKALGVRNAIISEYKRIFERFDAVLTPTMPFISPRFDEISGMSALETYHADVLSVPPNLSGLPHISMPCGYSEGMPVGMMLVADHWNDDILLSAAEEWQKRFDARSPEVSL
ncbi:Glutamyl-tRNA(Gln) amidotransferase subunit A [bioreactor metagenome]|jgi:aspartyl-tRNA(Asn)/glutamyl-tRNA(Gln) amidotransferase subunit A|uniref:Glutamyl-tRNA(Gln) amidotransferase subunit A n=1 Tax=bioreactor metagenome TaxID=1076179 RepID=A0A645AN58_9ZZZZ|nr:tRNA amidotransferase [Methanomassiliicoccales archaeon RumEn M2]MDI9378871.1 amidase family protein [Candidatus Thermoplasmatota archaeon]